MNVKGLRYFGAVAQFGSFTRAAETLGVAQSAVSMAVKKLENELGLQLIDRQDRSVTLTDEGRRLLHHARLVEQALADADLEMRELRGLGQGNVRVGIPGMMGSYFFPPVLMAFRHRYPDLDLTVIEGGTWELQRMLENKELDLGVIVEDFAPPELEIRPILRAEMLVVVASGHPLAAQQSVSYRTFFAQDLVMFKEGYFHRKVVDQLAREIDAQPRIVFETNLVPLIKQIVKQEFGVTTLLRMVVEEEPELTAIPFSEPVWLNLGIAWRRDGYLSRANRAFVDFLIEQLPEAQSRSGDEGETS